MNHPLTRSLLAFALLALVWASPARAQNPMLELVTDAVVAPIYIASAGGDDERLFIVERGGRVRIVAAGVLLPTPFLDIGSLVDQSGEGGLLSIAFHPEYSNEPNDPNDPPVPWVFVSYTAPGVGGNALTSVIARYELSADPNVLDPASAKTLITVDQPSANHNGGLLQFNPLNGFLYIGLGDGGGGGVACPAQQPAEALGKMLRIDVNLAIDAAPWYEVPVTNPFYDPVDPNDPNNPGDGVLDTIWAAGFRNPWRFSFDRVTHELWIGDVGESQIEEIDFEPATSTGGRNYGWSVKEGTECVVSGDPVNVGCPVGTPRCSSNTYVSPVFEYEHASAGGSAITGGYVYRGGRAPGFVGRYVFGDSSTGEIFALKVGLLNLESDVLSSADLQAPVSFGEDSEGELYVADIAANRVYRLRLDLVVLTGDLKCIVKMNEKTAKFGDTVEKAYRKCVSDAAKGKLAPGTLDECLVGNSSLSNGVVAIRNIDVKYCQTDPPPFGYSGFLPSADQTLVSEDALIHDLFGADLDLAISTEKVTAKCQSQVLKGMDACQRARRNEFVRCKKTGVKQDTLVNAADIELCISADPKGKVAKACAPAQSKLALKTIPKSCVEKGIDLSDAFPGCATDLPIALAECIDAAGICRECQWASGVDALGLDCGVGCLTPPE